MRHAAVANGSLVAFQFHIYVVVGYVVWNVHTLSCTSVVYGHTSLRLLYRCTYDRFFFFYFLLLVYRNVLFWVEGNFGSSET